MIQSCDHLRKCAFYKGKLLRMPPDADFMKSFFCRRESDKCARNIRARKEPVEDTNNRLTPLG